MTVGDGMSEESIAIVGIACRFPGGANSPEEFWKLMREGVDAIVEVPEERWNKETFIDPERSKPGKIYTKWGGYISGMDEFDPNFFGISPREAAFIDPQQRLMLEVAWEAFEDAGLKPEDFSDSRTGVYVGASGMEYGEITKSRTERNIIGAHTMTGTSNCLLSNRISYILNLHGPSITIDTACSSSLVALHLARQSILRGESECSLVGGVNLLMKPESTLGFAKASMLSPDGRCKSFDSRANGYVRSEGVGVIIIKKLSQAIVDKNNIYAVIRGSMINQDGRTKGISLPNGEAQKRILIDVYRKAGINTADVRCLEAHGTGTQVGDPIEANALGTVFSKKRNVDDFCYIGSVKSNIGHLEPASGIAGLIKGALMLKHRLIVPTIHYKEGNPQIPFNQYNFRVPQTVEPWPYKDKPGYVGINSFGFGGTNAHIILEGVDAPKSSKKQRDKKGGEEVVYLLPLSAKTEGSLLGNAERLLAQLRSYKGNVQDYSIQDIVSSAAKRKTHHQAHRAVFAVKFIGDLIEKLEDYIDNKPNKNVFVGGNLRDDKKIVFVYTGMGPQWWAMGRELLKNVPFFREAIERCDKFFTPLARWSLIDELLADEEASKMDETEYAQPTNFAIQYGLTELWKLWGVKPDIIVGHSTGEVASMHAASVLSLEDAVTTIYYRSKLQQKTANQGKMMAVALSEKKADSIVAYYKDRVSVAAINSPTSLTLSGDSEALEEIFESLEKKDIFCKFLYVNIPYHSPAMDQLKEETYKSLSRIKPMTATTQIYSTVYGDIIDGRDIDAKYWFKNMRNSVRFSDAINKILKNGNQVFIEIGPHPVLGSAISECSMKLGKEKPAVFPSIKRKMPELEQLLGSLAGIYTSGVMVDWENISPDAVNYIKLPTYSWQHQKYWHESQDGMDARIAKHVHPLLQNSMNIGHPSWKTDLMPESYPFIKDHQVQGSIVIPGAAYAEVAFAIGNKFIGSKEYSMENFKIHKALIVPEDDKTTMNTVFNIDKGEFSIYSKKESVEIQELHASGKLSKRLTSKKNSTRLDVDNLKTTFDPAPFTLDYFFNSVVERGLYLGPTFQGLGKLWYGEEDGKQSVLGLVTIPEGLKKEYKKYHFHPAVLDSCFQLGIGAILYHPELSDEINGLYLPVGIREASLYGSLDETFYCYSQLVSGDSRFLEVNIWVIDRKGDLIAEFLGFRAKYLAGSAENTENIYRNWLYRFNWTYSPLSGNVGKATPASFLSLDGMEAAVRQDVKDWSGYLNRTNYYDHVELEIDELCRHYIYEALTELGWKPKEQSRFSTVPLQKALGIGKRYSRLFNRMLEILSDGGWIKSCGDSWQVLTDNIPCKICSRKVWEKLAQQRPAYHSNLKLLSICGQNLAQVLAGKQEGLGLLFPDGPAPALENFYESSPDFRIYNILVQKVLSALLKNLPEYRKIRILEVGAGTGGMSSYIIPKLPADKVEYLFTDISHTFMTFAEDKFREYPFVTYQTLDLEKDLEAQGIQKNSFDIILSSNVFHATKNIKETIKKMQSILSSEGVMLFEELTRVMCMYDLVFGLLDGWWLFEDTELRTSHALLSQKNWKAVLKDAGFTKVCAVSDECDGEPQQSVLVTKGPKISTYNEQKQKSDRPKELWLIFTDFSGVGERLEQKAKVNVIDVVLVFNGNSYEKLGEKHFIIDSSKSKDMETLFLNIGANAYSVIKIVYLWNIDNYHYGGIETAKELEGAQGSCHSLITLIKAIDRSAIKAPLKISLVSRGLYKIHPEDDAISIEQAPLWGIGRVLINEHPEFTTTLIDIGPKITDCDIDGLFAELADQNSDEEIAIRGSSRYTARLEREKVGGGVLIERDNSYSFTVANSTPGMIDGVILKTKKRKAPEEGEVEVEVFASGLQFKDILKALDKIEPEALQDTLTANLFGIDCSGKISAVGKSVEGFQVGDSVVAFARDTLSPYVTTPSSLVIKKPINISFEEAATLPINLLTAYYALNRCGQIKKGEKVLIHGATGGVGLAAIKIAKHVGAEIFATVGSKEKVDYLHSIGIQQVFDSRSLAFADEILEATCGGGVDLILNSLSGEAIHQGIKILKPWGRFLEIGNKDIYENRSLELLHFKNNISYFVIDIDRMLYSQPEAVSHIFGEVMQFIEDGVFHATPYRVFNINDVKRAFRYMSRSRHEGKIIISLKDKGSVDIIPQLNDMPQFKPDVTYMIIGGLGGFGLATAKSLIANGAKNLALVGRSGLENKEGAKSAIDSFKNRGINIEIFKVDISNAYDVKEMFSTLKKSMPPLCGIIHSAMVLDDAMLLNMTKDCFDKVVSSKIGGTWNLHINSIDIPLDFFILYSSMTALIGNVGQANYVAANMFLDRFAYYRRSLGLPALSINWGALLDVGYVARHSELTDYIEKTGFKGFTPQQAFALISLFQKLNITQIGALDMNWPKYGKYNTMASKSLRFQHLINESVTEDESKTGDDGSKSIYEAVIAATPDNQILILKEYLGQQIARIFEIPEQSLELEKSLTEMGLDSLMAVEMQSIISDKLSINYPIISLMKGPNISQLAISLLEKILGEVEYDYDPNSLLEEFDSEDLLQAIEAVGEDS